MDTLQFKTILNNQNKMYSIGDVPKKYFEILFNNNHFGIIFTQNKHIYTHNYLAEELLNSPLVGEFQHYDELIGYKNTVFNYDLVVKSEIKSVCISITEISDTEVLWIFLDITKRVEFREELLFQKHLAEYNSNHDLLTKLPNRTKCIDIINKNINNQTPFSLLFIDIDNFKLVNDTHGHHIGDDVLILFSKKLRKMFPDTEVFRLSGDEFAIICENNRETATYIARTLIKQNEQPLDYDYNEYLNSIYITCSVGITFFPDDAISLNKLLTNVDIALYNNKKKGKNSYTIYNPQMKIDKLKEIIIKNDILDSIERDFFELYYQPQIDSRTGEVVGLEGLVRWNHPDKGFLPPSEFIPIAEKNGLIIKLDRYLMKKGIAQVRKLKRELGFKGKLSLNLSTKQLQNDFIDFVQDLINGCDLTTRCIKLEITETEVMNNFKLSLNTLNKLDSMGIDLVIDDFGTGYSSLMYLSELPIKTLKIDKIFINKIGTNETVLKTIISLAKNLNLNIIAEGVETQEQIDWLKEEGVYIIQGYYYSKPLPFDELVDKYFKSVEN